MKLTLADFELNANKCQFNLRPCWSAGNTNNISWTSLVLHTFGCESTGDRGTRRKVKASDFILTFIANRPAAAEIYHRLTDVTSCTRRKVRRSQNVTGVRPLVHPVSSFWGISVWTERVNNRPTNKALMSCLYFVAFITYECRCPVYGKKSRVESII